MIINCPVCGDVRRKTLLTESGEGFSDEKALFCASCGLVFLNPRIDNDELKEYYLSNSFRADFRADFNEETGDRQVLYNDAARRWKIAEPFLFGGKLLEIGCSSGEFLELANNRFDVYGIDPSSRDINAINLGTTHIGMFPEYDFPDVDKFDAICTFHTLEHVPDPQGFLDAVYERIDDDGIFILEYPDLSLAAKRRDKIFATYFQKSHLHDFSAFNLVLLLGRAGFRINYAIAPQQEYPRDKNVMLICAKSDEEKHVFVPDADRALALLRLLSEKLHEPI